MTRDEVLVDTIGEAVAASEDWIGGADDAYDLVRRALARLEARTAAEPKSAAPEAAEPPHNPKEEGE